MQIAGLQKTTLVDYPGKIAATIFTRGCSFCCPFCHNPELVVPEKFLPLIPEESIIDFLKTRVGKLQAVCITGGEPTIQKDIINFIGKIKKLGFLVKLDTNGSLPDVVEKIIQAGNVDYIAMDIKAPLEKYPLATNTKIQTSNIKKSISLIKNSDTESRERSRTIDYEFRTTVCHPIHEISDFEKIGKMLAGTPKEDNFVAKKYFIQNFVQSKHIDEHEKFKPFSAEELEKAKKIMEKFCEKVGVR